MPEHHHTVSGPISWRLSIGTSTVLAPFSDSNDTLSEKLVALTQQTDVAGLQGHGTAGLRAASGKNHLPGKRDFRPAGRALQKMKS